MICKNVKCKIDFIPNRKNQLYCSTKCQNSVYKQNKCLKIKKDREPKKCENCNIFFKPNFYNTKFCNNCVEDVRAIQVQKWHLENEVQYKNRKKAYSNKSSTKNKKKEDYIKINNSTKDESISSCVYKSKYTLDEDVFLLENWNKMTKEELAFSLSRTYSSVQSRYKKIRVR